MYPKRRQRISLAIHPGDAMSAEVVYNGGSSFTLSLHNTTTGANFTTTLRSNKAAHSSAEWILEAPYSGGILPLSDFGTASFTNASATLNGHSDSIKESGSHPSTISIT